MTTGPEFVASSSLSVHTLPDGTRIRDYEITGLIGEGGFGIVYLAYDHSLQRRVAIKEYMPSAMASRSAHSPTVVVKSDRHADTFKVGLKSFVNEARLLARFDHPSLVKVYRFWEENGTAYMVMPYYEGPTLKRALAELGHVPDEAELRTWLRPLLDALAVMHAAHCFHRDIAPDNILLTPSGPLLLDFGAARRVIGDMTHALTVVLKPGFAPIEQYGEVSSMAQGAWTDLYALASVVYAAVTGQPPMSSVERLMDDRLRPLSELAAGRYSEPFLTAIDAALAVRPADRPQDVAAFRTLLDGRVLRKAPSPGFASTYSAPLELTLPEDDMAAVVASNLAPTGPPAAAALRVPALRVSARPVPTDIDIPTDPLHPAASNEPASRAAATAPRSKTALYAGFAAAAVLALAAGAYLASRPRATLQAPGAAPATAATVPPPAAAVAPTFSPVAPTAAPASAAALTVPTPSLPMIDESPLASDRPTGAAKETKARPNATAPTGAAKPRRPAPAEAVPRAPADRPAPTNTAVTQGKCSDILQKASLEPLTPAEATFLKRECR